jgi:hypothetical protein
MEARVGDEIVVPGHKVGQVTRTAVVVELRGEGGGPPYLVRWTDDGHEGLYFPGSDAGVTPRA